MITDFDGHWWDTGGEGTFESDASTYLSGRARLMAGERSAWTYLISHLVCNTSDSTKFEGVHHMGISRTRSLVCSRGR